MRYWLVSYALAVLFSGIPMLAQAGGDLSVMPAVMDEKAKPRDILKETIILTNESDHVISVYPTVEDINPENGEQSFNRANNSEDLSDSLANWIELSRGVVKIAPGEKREIPFIIRLNPNAVAGTYHAEISFGSGETRAAAEANGPLAVVAVNLEVTADIKEIMQLNAFDVDTVAFTGDDVLFNFQLQNIGNQELEPKGEIRIYDRKGREVAAIDVNKEGRMVSPDQVAQLASVWSAANGFGKFKALLNVNYGRGQTASVQDTVFFWVIPWKQIFGLLVVSLIAIIALALYFHRWLEERHLGKLAHAGFLKHDAIATIQKAREPAQKKGIFSLFDRGGVAQTLPPRPLPLPVAPSPVEHPLERARSPLLSEDHKIDLKQMRAAQEESRAIHSDAGVSSEGHGAVINLKKRQ